jgi:hypothetical protein
MTDAPEDTPAPIEAPAPSTAPARLAIVLGVALIVVLATTTLVQGHRAGDLRSEARDRTAAERVAGEFAEALFTFRSAKPTANLDRLQALATKAYKPRVDAARKLAVTEQVPPDQQLTSQTRITDVYLTEIDGDSAHAVTRGSWDVSSGDEHAALALYLRIDLKKEKGTWRVDSANGITARPAATDSSSPSAAPSSTSSTSTTSTTSTSTTTGR